MRGTAHATLQRTAATLRTHAAPAAIARPFSSFAPAKFRTTRTPRQAQPEPLPWFVDAATAPTAPTSEPAPLATAPVPTAPPSHLPEPLHPLHAHLSVSPFLDRDSLRYIHAREADPEGSWCDWVVMATLREGRERGIRGAVESVRMFLAKNPVEFAPSSASSDPLFPPPFAPPSNNPQITGIPSAPSKHARSRSRGPPPTRADQATGWALLDAGTLVVHVFTREGRETYGRSIEEVWDGLLSEQGGGRETRARRELERAGEREKELLENMAEVQREIDAEEEAERRRV